MSEFSFGDADDSLYLDEAALQAIESIERGSPPPVQHRGSLATSRSNGRPLAQSKIPFIPPPPPSSDGFEFLDTIPDSQLAALETAARAPPAPRRSFPSRSHLNAGTGSSSSQSHQTHLTFRKEDPTTRGKRWDRTEFSKTGRRKVQPPQRGQIKVKPKARGWAEMDDEEEEDWGEDGPILPEPACDVHLPYGPQRHVLNEAMQSTYIYPTNRPRRDYQFEIVQAALTDNCLVALPTGLGKTLIAGVVMLNYYRWFPSGKIVFLAPTKPLVQQQQIACHETCGIPQADSAIMMGEGYTIAERRELWDQKRVFYCTPQTLMNDMAHKAIDPQDIVLAVFDEAHKASGNYAYTTINAYLMAHHPYYRVLALTATPGSTVDKVQTVIDALHISRIELREAESFEIKKYVNEKTIETHYIEVEGVLAEFRDGWVKFMKPLVSQLINVDILESKDLMCTSLRAFRVLSAKTELGRRNRAGGGAGPGFAFGVLTQLHKMATAMGHLLEFSVSMFATALQELGGAPAGAETTTKAKGKKPNNKLAANPDFRLLRDGALAYIRDCDSGEHGLQKCDKHPKMKMTLDLLVAYFEQAKLDCDRDGTSNDTRAMVFCTYRPCVLDLVDMLNAKSDLLRATKFVGQGTGKTEGDSGFNQRQQKQAVKDFKAGKYNILVATAVGEEGLDIGEVDMVICYDMPKASIKLLQRIGRTGRKRRGQVHVLMTKGREDFNYAGAQDTHRDIQLEILHSRNLELFEDVERLLPPGQGPKCIEQEMQIEEWVVEGPASRKRAAPSKAPKRVRGEPVPDGAQIGFKSVLEIIQDVQDSPAEPVKKTKAKAPAKRKAKKVVEVTDGSDDDLPDVRDLGTEKPKAVRESKAVKETKTKAPSKRKAKAVQVISDSDDDNLPDVLELVQRRPGSDEDADASPPPTKKRKVASKAAPAKSAKPKKAASKKAPSPVPLPSPRPSRSPAASPSPPAPSPVRLAAGGTGINFLLAEPDHERARRSHNTPARSPALILPSSTSPSPPPQQVPGVTQPVQRLDSSLAAKAGFSQIDMSYVLQSSDDELLLLPAESVANPAAQDREMMPPPELPSSPVAAMATQFPVRRFGLGGRRARVVQESSEQDSPLPPETLVAESPPRLRRHVDTSPIVAMGDRRMKKQKLRRTVMIESEVEVSGSDTPDEASSDYENESDRLFANDFQPTQAPKGYNQRAAYAAGLATPDSAKRDKGPAFARRGLTQKFLSKARKPVLLTDDEQSGSENEYELGSFVCDDEDLDFDPSSQNHDL